jgi:hypothetical protein
MEDRKRHRIGISQHQPHINADVTPQKYIQRDGRTPSGKRSPYSRLAALELPRASPYANANRRILVF